MAQINKTDWVWEQAELTLRYRRRPIFSNRDPIAPYLTVKKQCENLYAQVQQLAHQLKKMRQNREPDVRMEAVAEAIQAKQRTISDVEYKWNDLRPHVRIAICPYCKKEVWLRMGLFSLSDPFWYKQIDIRQDVPHYARCQHLFCITGALGLNGNQPTEQYAPPQAEKPLLYMAAEVPFVLPRLLDLGCTAVLHAIPVSPSYTAYPITYFTSTPLAEFEHFCLPWGSQQFRGRVEPYVGAASFTGTRSDVQIYDLSEALANEQLLWLDGQDTGKLVGMKQSCYPYEGVNGRHHPYTIENGIIQDLPNPQPSPPIYLK